jgi:hypothetical protein
VVGRRRDRGRVVAKWKRWSAECDVLGNGLRPAANDMFTQAMVVGAAGSTRGRGNECHSRSMTSCGPINLNHSQHAALANRKLRRSLLLPALAAKQGFVLSVAASGS